MPGLTGSGLPGLESCHSIAANPCLGGAEGGGADRVGQWCKLPGLKLEKSVSNIAITDKQLCTPPACTPQLAICYLPGLCGRTVPGDSSDSERYDFSSLARRLRCVWEGGRCTMHNLALRCTTTRRRTWKRCKDGLHRTTYTLKTTQTCPGYLPERITKPSILTSGEKNKSEQKLIPAKLFNIFTKRKRKGD